MIHWQTNEALQSLKRHTGKSINWFLSWFWFIFPVAAPVMYIRLCEIKCNKLALEYNCLETWTPPGMFRRFLVNRPKGMNLLQISGLLFLVSFCLKRFLQSGLRLHLWTRTIWPDGDLQVQWDRKVHMLHHMTAELTCRRLCVLPAVGFYFLVWFYLHSLETSSVLHKMGGAMSRQQDFSSTGHIKPAWPCKLFKLSQMVF